MRLQTSTDCAIRILQYLHEHRRGGLHSAVRITEQIGIAYPFFTKVANQLKRHGLLTSVQGRNGGYHLGKSAHEISLYDVFLCIEGELLLNRCLNGHPCTRGEHKDCKLHSVLHGLQGRVIAELSGQTIADLVDESLASA